VSEPEAKKHGGVFRYFNSAVVGVAFLIVALVISLARVLSIRKELYDPSMAVVRIAHWQLEMGYREALDEIIAEYNRIHEKDKVKVVQMAVTEKVFKQWLNTHLIAGTAPDIAEMGMAKMTQTGAYVAKYFMPLTDIIGEPNPYNEGTDLEGVPWRDTFIDGMQGGYLEDLQDYYRVPTTFWATRLYYNKDMLREATGKDRPPATLGELLAACDAVRRLGEKKGRKLIPIAGSMYSKNLFFLKFGAPFTAVYEPKVDLDLNGSVTALETYAAFERGDVSFDDPQMVALFECIKTLCDQFSKGFMAMGREQAAFMFVQGNAAMIATGSWDANSLFKQAKFKVGVMGFPAPAPGERWGDLVKGKSNEAQGAAGAGYGINKFSRHREWAIDFMRFFSSKKYNQQFNRKANWVPCILGTTPTEEMMAFMPDPVGISSGSGLYFRRGGPVSTKFEGQLWLLLSGEITYEEFKETMMKTIRDPKMGTQKVWEKEYEKFRDMARNIERLLAVESTLLETGSEYPELSLRYKRALTKQVLLNNGEDIRALYYAQNKRRLPRN